MYRWRGAQAASALFSGIIKKTPTPTTSTSSNLLVPLSSRCHLSSFGRVSNEDRRWWIVHLECSPDVTPGTFVGWLDSCGTHTQKKLIERNIWTIEQVAALSSDLVDELRYQEGCLHMDVVWEHARTIMPPLKQREKAGSVEMELHDRIKELRKKRELERRREEIIKERKETAEGRDRTMAELRESIAKKKEMLRAKQAAREAAMRNATSSTEDSS